MRKNIRLATVLLAGLMVAWSVFIPVFEGPDESGHYCHGEYIAKRKKLPNFLVQDGCFLAYPPGYYALAAPIIALRPAANFDDEQIQPNPAYVSNRKGGDVFAKYIHPQSELFFKWNPLLQTVHLVRLVSVALGLGIVFLTVKAAKLTWSLRGTKRWFPYTSILLFFNPMFLHTFSLVTNVTLVSFLAAAFIYLHLKQEASGNSGKLALLQGIVMGLGAITKINMLSLAGGYAFTLLTSKWKERQKLKHLGFVILGFITSAGWYIWRTLRLYGEPFEINIAASFRGASMTRMQDMGLINYWSSFPDTLFRTFWSGYGLNKVWLPDVAVVGLLIMTLFVCFGFFSSYRKLPRLVKVLWFYVAAVLLGHVFINMKTEAFHAKDIFTAFLPLAICAGVGIGSIVGMFRKKIHLRRGRVFLIAAVSFAFYAKFELVRLIKAGLSLIGASGFYTKESFLLSPVVSALVWKAGTIVLLVWGLVLFVGRWKPTMAGWRSVIAILSVVGLVILASASYLLYSEFL